MFPPCGVVTLLTDFGLDDPFVGVMKGTILREYPQAQLLDLTHGIVAQDVAASAFWLERCYRWFPRGSVHVAVVDPTVGSARKALAAHFDDHYFVAPDNGLLPSRITQGPDAKVVELDAGSLSLEPLSTTFHGRDLFGPIAGMLASGRKALDQLGSPASQPVRSVLPQPTRRGNVLSGRICVIDHFGNAITNIERSLVPEALEHANARVALVELPLSRTYADVKAGDLAALFSSFGTLEIAQRNGSAADRLGLRTGDAVELRLHANA